MDKYPDQHPEATESLLQGYEVCYLADTGGKWDPSFYLCIATQTAMMRSELNSYYKAVRSPDGDVFENGKFLEYLNFCTASAPPSHR